MMDIIELSRANCEKFYKLFKAITFTVYINIVNFYNYKLHVHFRSH